MKIIPAIFEEREIRRLYDEKTETWFFSVVDIVQIPFKLRRPTNDQREEIRHFALKIRNPFRNFKPQ